MASRGEDPVWGGNQEFGCGEEGEPMATGGVLSCPRGSAQRCHDASIEGVEAGQTSSASCRSPLRSWLPLCTEPLSPSSSLTSLLQLYSLTSWKPPLCTPLDFFGSVLCFSPARGLFSTKLECVVGSRSHLPCSKLCKCSFNQLL